MAEHVCLEIVGYQLTFSVADSDSNFADICDVDAGTKEECPYCNLIDCYGDCDGSKGDIDGLETEEETASRRDYNAACDGIESLLLNLVSSGCVLNDARDDFRDRESLEKALKDAIDGCANNL